MIRSLIPALLLAVPALAHAQTDERLRAALAAPDRPVEHRVRDEARRVADIVRLTGIVEGTRVLDVGGGGGYLALVLSPLAGATGAVYIHNTPGWIAQFPSMDPAAMAARISRPNIGYVVSTWTDIPGEAEAYDVIVMGQVYHDAVLEGADIPVMSRRLFDLLRPGGRLVVEDHDALSADPLARAVALHRISYEQVRSDLEAAGFLAGETVRIDTPQDTRKMNVFHPGVRSRTDRFIAAFSKPAG